MKLSESVKPISYLKSHTSRINAATIAAASPVNPEKQAFGVGRFYSSAAGAADHSVNLLINISFAVLARILRVMGGKRRFTTGASAMARFRPLYAIAVLASVVFLPLPADATPITEVHVQNTSVAFGTAFGDLGGFVLDRDDVAAGTLLSAELAHTIETTFPDPRLDPVLGDTFGTLDNLTFLTADLVRFGNAGDQLVALYMQIFTDLNALIGGVGTWTLTSTPVGSQGYSLFGGIVNSGSSPATCAASAGDFCIVTGTANVEFYEVTGTFDPHGATLPAAAVPEPGTLALLGIGLAAVEITRRKKTA